MEITERLKEIILQETNIDILTKTRKREVVEARALYCYLIRILSPKLTLESIGNSLDLVHSTVIHLLKNYSMYESSNQQLRVTRKAIVKHFQLKEENNMDVSFEVRQFNSEINRLNELVERLTDNNSELILKYNKEIHNKKKFDFEIIDKLNQLMVDTNGTEKNDLIQVRLDAFYHMNKIKPDTWYDEQKEERMNIIGQNGNNGEHYAKERAENLMKLKKK